MKTSIATVKGGKTAKPEGKDKRKSLASSMAPSSSLISSQGFNNFHTGSSLFEDSEADSYASLQDVNKYIEDKIKLMKETQKALNRAAILGGFVPDYIVENEDLVLPYLHKFQGVVFVVDIAGFTALTEAYSLNGKGGTEQLTKTLANYMGPLAECILRAGGDIIKYAGDAILSVWRVKTITGGLRNAGDFPSVLQKVIDCALYCQEKYGSYVTDILITIRVKIGIGAGTCFHAGLGNNFYQHYVLFGPGVVAASGAEHQCVSGDVTLHESAWKYLNPKHYTVTNTAEAAEYVKVTGIVHYFYPDARGRPTKVSNQPSVPKSSVIAARRSANLSMKVAGAQRDGGGDVVRPILDKMSQKVVDLKISAEGRLRKYVIPPVLKKLDDDIPLDYLNESRMVSIVFVHVSHTDFEQDNSYGTNMAAVVQACFLEIFKSVTGLNGCLTKVIMFDKGLTYLVTFGLPGYIQDNQTANSLTFAKRMLSALKTVPDVLEVSIGCTSGSTYCGVLGHPKRHEYTVIGRQVNKAARLMVNYPGKVTCSQDSFYSSKLPGGYFLLLEAKTLKGMTNVGKIYEYVGAEIGSKQSRKQYEFPLLGRHHEIKVVINNLVACQQEFDKALNSAENRWKGLLNVHNDTHVPTFAVSMIIIEGENGIGKSRFLSACMNDAEHLGWKIFSVVLSMQHAALNLYAVEKLLTQCLGMEDMHDATARAKHVKAIVEKIPGLDVNAAMDALDDIFHLKLTPTTKFSYQDSVVVHHTIHRILIKVLRQVHPRTLILFCVEGVHFMSKYSWEYLEYISRLPSVRTLMTLRRNSDGLPRIPDVAYKICYHSPHVSTLRLPGLPHKYILPLACQILEVRAIPKELENIIIMKSQGNPTWVEDVLNEFLSQEKIKIVNHAKNSTLPLDANLSVVDDHYILKKALGPAIKSKFLNLNSEYNFLDSEISKVAVAPANSKGQGDPTGRICLIKSNTNLNTGPISGSLKEKILDTFDALNTNEQMMVKCACVLGPQFSHNMLNRLLPLYGKDAKGHLSSFRILMEENIFSCASMSKKDRIATGSIARPAQCYCNHTEGILDNFPEEYEQDLAQTSKPDLPLYCFCKYVKFSRNSMVEVVYELLTEDLKKELHLKAAKHLETSAIQCVSCGGPETTYLYGFALKDTLGEEKNEGIEGVDIPTGRTSRHVSADINRRNLHARLKIKQQFYATEGHTRPAASVDGQSGATEDTETKNSRVSKTTIVARWNEVKNTLESDGSQLAAVEFQILNTLMLYYERKVGISCFCRCWKKRLSEISGSRSHGRSGKGTDASSAKGRGSDAGSNNNASLASKNKNNTTSSGKGGRNTITSDDDVNLIEDGGIDILDIRGCQCAAIQARVCVELVKHYTKAQKFGKCIHYLLDAAEAFTAIRNFNQALHFLNEASLLMKGITDGKIVVAEDVEDAVVNSKDIDPRMMFLHGLCYYSVGSYAESKAALSQALNLMGMPWPQETKPRQIKSSLLSASFKLWEIYHGCGCFVAEDKYPNGDKITNVTAEKITAVSYLHKIYLATQNVEMALLAATWHVILSEKLGGFLEDVIPAYCAMTELYTSLGKSKKASFYEDKALTVVREQGFDTSKDALALLTIANMFFSLSNNRLCRGEFKGCEEAGYLSIGIADVLKDTTLSIHVFPALIRSLMYTLQLSEVLAALQNLWHLAQSEEHWIGTAAYFYLVLDMTLELCCPVESFYYCEQFVTGLDRKDDVDMHKEYEIQFNLEASLTLWYTRYRKLEEAMAWRSQANFHRPKIITMHSVSGVLKLLECCLISANYHLKENLFQLYDSDRKDAKEMINELQKLVKVLPVFQPRFYHLLAYYSKICNRKRKAMHYLKRATKIAKLHGNRFEEEFVKHSRLVWLMERTKENQEVMDFWLDHTENFIDWHPVGQIPWSKMMYSLPLWPWRFSDEKATPDRI